MHKNEDSSNPRVEVANIVGPNVPRREPNPVTIEEVKEVCETALRERDEANAALSALRYKTQYQDEAIAKASEAVAFANEVITETREIMDRLREGLEESNRLKEIYHEEWMINSQLVAEIRDIASKVSLQSNSMKYIEAIGDIIALIDKDDDDQ